VDLVGIEPTCVLSTINASTSLVNIYWIVDTLEGLLLTSVSPTNHRVARERQSFELSSIIQWSRQRQAAMRVSSAEENETMLLSPFRTCVPF